MPSIEIQHVISCSSEDKSHPAENLLRPEGTHKWKCASAGEKSASVVLQLKQSSQIVSIDIGNEGSAFIEVLVGKAAAAADSEFEVLLVASAFMSPLESRDGTNRTAVRMFGVDKLNKVTAAEKWDRVKVVCTQPFSKLSQYGLSFIKLHSAKSDSEEKVKTKKFGAFMIKDEGEDIAIGSLFASRGKSQTEDTGIPAGAAAMRAATRLADEASAHSPKPAKITNAFAESKTVVKKPDKKEEKREEKKIEEKKPSNQPGASKRATDLPAVGKVKPKKPRWESDSDTDNDDAPLSSRKNSRDDDKIKAKKVAEKPHLKRSHTEPSTPKVPFSKVMAKVTFVLSGFQNPRRGELRDQCLEMGAKYRGDWGPGCTHLICAFTNTPKYQQVSGKGRIVTKGWVTDCHKQGRLLPWRKYRLGDADSPDESSESEAEAPKRPSKQSPEWKPSKDPEETKKTEEATQSKAVSPPQGKEDISSKRSRPKKPAIKFESSESESEKPTPSKKSRPKKPAIKFETSESDSGGDTEDELRKVKEKEERLKNDVPSSSKQDVDDVSQIKDVKSPEKDDDAFGNSTDEDELVNGSVINVDMDNGADSSDSGLPDLPHFFSDKNFFFYGEFPKGEQRLLQRYIYAYNGEVEDYMSGRVKFVITAQPWDDNFEDALTENPDLVFVRPRWLRACHDRRRMVPYQAHVVVPS